MLNLTIKICDHPNIFLRHVGHRNTDTEMIIKIPNFYKKTVRIRI